MANGKGKPGKAEEKELAAIIVFLASLKEGNQELARRKRAELEKGGATIDLSGENSRP